MILFDEWIFNFELFRNGITGNLMHWLENSLSFPISSSRFQDWNIPGFDSNRGGEVRIVKIFKFAIISQLLFVSKDLLLDFEFFVTTHYKYILNLNHSNLIKVSNNYYILFLATSFWKKIISQVFDFFLKICGKAKNLIFLSLS